MKLCFLPAGQQLVHEDAEGPVICGNVMTFIQDDLWSHILWCTTECPRLLPKADLLSKAKIHL